MKITRLKIRSKFRGLTTPFELHFRQPDYNYSPGDINEPICLVGLNGSGKSNTLEALCEIFYYLEIKTIASQKDLAKLDERYDSLGFEVEYIISNYKWKTILNKIEGTAPFDENAVVTVSCIKKAFSTIQILVKSPTSGIPAYVLKSDLWSLALPSKVIGYSSGQNELISNPFIKLDYHYFDEFIKSTSDVQVAHSTDVNRMFFMDYESNKLVVLANYLFQEGDRLDRIDALELNKKLRIKHLHSFSMTIQFKNYAGDYVPFPSELNLGIDLLKQCATTWYDNKEELEQEVNREILLLKKVANENEARKRITAKHFKNRIVELSFYTDAAVRKAFRSVFKQEYELFRLLYLLRLMNIHTQKPATRTLIKDASQGTNLSDLIPKPAGDDLLFNIDAIKFSKENVKDPVTYKQLSDGEHQLLHVMGTLNLMKENDTLFILDEPETHFNPEWRAKMVQLIMKRNTGIGVEQDHFITSHSPFIISDCKPNNVYIFNKTGNEVKVKTAHERRLNTFGTGVNILTDEVFNKNESQGDYSLAVLNEIKNRPLRSLSAIQKAKEAAIVLGESVEKTLLFRKLLMAEDKLKARLKGKVKPAANAKIKRQRKASPQKPNNSRARVKDKNASGSSKKPRRPGVSAIKKKAASKVKARSARVTKKKRK